MKFFLVGYLASGKSNIGKKLSHILKLDFIDMEEYMENKINQTLFHYYRNLGEVKYKDLEYEVFKEIVETRDNFVLSTSDMTPCIYDVLDIMKKKGTIIYLKMNENLLVERLKNARKVRFQIADIPSYELEDFIKEQLKEREEKCYGKASIIVDASVLSADQIANIIKYQDVLNSPVKDNK